MSLPSGPKPVSRIGFYYQPDSLHYTLSDLNLWSPRLKELGAGWLILKAPSERAIPEAFLTGLLENGIQPVLHFDLSLHTRPDMESLSLLFSTYASWGVHMAALYDRPNLRRNWPATSWAQSDLVERFLDIYLPLARWASDAGLTNIFPPLEPGGDYWDTAFLRAALQGIQRRGQDALLQRLVLGAYGWSDAHPLRWGAGGPERWPGARPYLTPSGQEDQRGLYIFDWYNAISTAILQQECPILLMGAGSRLKAGPDGLVSEVDEANHAHHNLEIARLLSPDLAGQNAIPGNVLAACFWLLAAPAGSPQAASAWYQPDGTPMTAATALRIWNNGQLEQPDPGEGGPALAGEISPVDPLETESGLPEAGEAAETAPPATPGETAPAPLPVAETPTPKAVPPRPEAHPISHYLLLPLYEWGAAEWHLDAARPFILRHRPTIGFSAKEAAMAGHVTVVGSEQIFPDRLLAELRASGSIVRRINGDGTEIASQLANL